MGAGEQYLMLWRKWSRDFDPAWHLAYLKCHAPIPPDWLMWAAFGFDYNDMARVSDDPEDFPGVRWLETQGLADFARFKDWWDNSLPK